MNLKIKKNNLKKIGCICFLCLYFTTKLLWDMVPYVFELLSIVLIAYGAVKAFTTKIHRRTFLIVIFFVFSLYVILNAYIQDTNKQIQRAIYEYIFYMLIFWATYYWGRKTRIENYSELLLKIGFIICVLSWVEYLSHHYILPNDIQYSDYVGFRTIVFSRTFLAHGMVLAFFSILGFYMYLKSKKMKHFIYGIFSFVTIMSTGSRGPLAACFIGIFLMIIIFEFKKNGGSIKKIIFVMIGGIILGIVWYLLTSNFQLSNATLNYFLNRLRSVLDWSSDEGNTGRIIIWTHYYKIFQNNFWFGVGPSQTGSWNLSGIYGATESGILKRLCELGIVGTLLHYIFVFSILIKGIGTLRRTNDDNLIFYIGLFMTVFIDDITLQATEEIIVSYFMWYALAGIENSKNRLELQKG